MIKVFIVFLIVLVFAFLLFVLVYIQNKIRDETFNPTKESNLPSESQISARYSVDTGYTIVKSKYDISYDTTIIFCKGRQGTIRTEYRKIIKAFKYFPINFITCDYPGFGYDYDVRTPTYNDTMDSVINMYNEACDTWPNSKIIIWAHSLGTHFALKLCTILEDEGKHYKLILLSPFSSAIGLKTDNRLIAELISTVVDILDNIKLIQKINSEVMILHSPTDDLIPISCSKDLDRECKNSILIKISGAHSNPIFTIDNGNVIINFIGIKCNNEDLLSFIRAVNSSKTLNF